MDEQNLSRYTMALMSLRKGGKVGHGDAYLGSQHSTSWRQENYKFKVSLRFLARPVSKTRQNNTHHRQTDAHTRYSNTLQYEQPLDYHSQLNKLVPKGQISYNLTDTEVWSGQIQRLKSEESQSGPRGSGEK